MLGISKNSYGENMKTEFPAKALNQSEFFGAFKNVN